jgi:molybdate transport system regulatory protein
MQLASGETLCATLSHDQLQQLKLQPGDAVIASFNAENAIVATLL